MNSFFVSGISSIFASRNFLCHVYFAQFMDRPDAWRRAGSISGERPFGCVDAIGYCRRVANGRIAGPCRQCAGQPRGTGFPLPRSGYRTGTVRVQRHARGHCRRRLFPARMAGRIAAGCRFRGLFTDRPNIRPMPYSGFYSPLHPLDMVIAGNSRPAVAGLPP